MRKPCSKCGREPRRKGQRLGRLCHAEDMRARRAADKRDPRRVIFRALKRFDVPGQTIEDRQ